MVPFRDPLLPQTLTEHLLCAGAVPGAWVMPRNRQAKILVFPGFLFSPRWLGLVSYPRGVRAWSLLMDPPSIAWIQPFLG